MRVDERGEQLGRQERRVAGEDEHLIRRPRPPPAPSAPRRPSRAGAPARRRRSSSKASAVSGDATTTSGSGPSGSAASTTQSTIRRPRIGWRCFATEERIRVPSPPAITTAASLVGITNLDGWGARIRTWDHGTKTRCLTTWPRPSAREGQSTRCYLRSSSSATRASAAHATTAAAASTTSAPASTGTSTTTSCETAAVHVTTRTSGLSCSRPHPA